MRQSLDMCAVLLTYYTVCGCCVGTLHLNCQTPATPATSGAVAEAIDYTTIDANYWKCADLKAVRLMKGEQTPRWTILARGLKADCGPSA